MPLLSAQAAHAAQPPHAALPAPAFTAKDVEQLARQALAASPVYALRELEVEQSGETLLIRGSVSSFYHKQLAQEAVRHVAEGVEVVNAIHVR